jgi:type II secretory pathway component PulF
MDPSLPTLRRLSNTHPSFASWWPWYTTFSQRQSLLRLIAVATEENLPLHPLMEAWATDERGVQIRRLRRLVHLLKEGTPLAGAIEQVPGILREEDVLAIRFGAQSGTLSATIRAMLNESESTMRSSLHPLPKTVIYSVTVLIVIVCIVAFICIKILPAFIKITQDFSMEPPAVLQSFVRITSAFVISWWVGAAGMLILLWSAISVRPGRFVRHTILGRLFRPIGELRFADVLQKLSIATGAGRPIPSALSTLARYHYDPTIRHKLLFVRNEVEQGADAWQSMATVGLLTQSEMHVLTTAEKVGNRSWALKQLALGKRRRMMRRAERIWELLLPAVVIAMGGFVLFCALTLFVPLTQLINSLL